jgi:Spy/CpxP family protein refolding chaperone
MKKTMMMLMAAGLLGVSTASAATDTNRTSNADTAAMRGTMCNPVLNGRNDCRNQWQQNERGMGPNAPMQHMNRPNGRGMNCGVSGMQQQLGLDERQSAEIEKLRQKHFTRMGAGRQELATLNGDLRIESLKSHPDKRKIERLSEQIGKKHALLARMKSSHIIEVASVLTPSQRSKMQKVMETRPMQGNCGMKCQ